MASQSGSDGPSGTKRTLSDGSNGGGKRTLANLFIGPPRDVRDPGIFHSLSLVAFLAWVGLGSDGLSSTCYGPEEAFLALGHDQYLAVFRRIAKIHGVQMFEDAERRTNRRRGWARQMSTRVPRADGREER